MTTKKKFLQDPKKLNFYFYNIFYNFQELVRHVILSLSVTLDTEVIYDNNKIINNIVSPQSASLVQWLSCWDSTLEVRSPVDERIFSTQKIIVACR